MMFWYFSSGGRRTRSDRRSAVFSAVPLSARSTMSTFDIEIKTDFEFEHQRNEQNVPVFDFKRDSARTWSRDWNRQGSTRAVPHLLFDGTDYVWNPDVWNGKRPLRCERAVEPRFHTQHRTRLVDFNVENRHRRTLALYVYTMQSVRWRPLTVGRSARGDPLHGREVAKTIYV